MSNTIIFHIKNHRVLVFLTVVCVFVLFGAANLRAEDRKIVTLHVDGEELVVPTKATTVGELIERADIELLEHDLVEPELETPIETDFNINVYRARPVTVVDGRSRSIVMTPYQSPKRIAESVGLTVYDEDEYVMERIDDILAEGAVGLKMTIDRSVPVTLNLYGKEISLRTQAETVAELLEEKGVELREDDKVRPAQDAALTDKTPVFVLGTGTDIRTEQQEIDFAVEEITDSAQEIGYRSIRTPGEKGSKTVTYKVFLENDQVVKKEPLQEVVTKQPKTQVVVVGSKAVAPTAVNITGGKQDWLIAAGIPEQHWGAVDAIVTRESGWNPNAVNPTSGACGLGQQLPCGKWAGAWNDPVAALVAMTGYVNARYGGWDGAVAFWNANHWY